MKVHEWQRRVDRTAQAAGPEPAFPLLELQQFMPHVRLHRRVEPRPAWAPRTAYERLWAHINTVVRRVAAHAVEPAVAQQNEWNAAVFDALEQIAARSAELHAAVSVARMTGNNHERRDEH